MRKLFVMVAAFLLALGAGGIGLAVAPAAPAFADTTGFTGQADSYDVSGESPLTFGGTIESGSTFTSINVTNEGETMQIYPTLPSDDGTPANCDFEAGAWDCSWDPQGWLETDDSNYPTESYLVIDEANADGTTSQDVLTFDVYDSTNDDAPDPNSDYPTQDFQFVPGGLDETTTSAYQYDYVGTSYYQVSSGEGDQFDYTKGCPAGVDNSDEGGVPVQETNGPATCDGANYVSLDAGEWRAEGDEAYYNSDEDDYDIDGETSAFFAVPDAPNLMSVTHNTDGTLTASGTGGLAGQNIEVLSGGNLASPLCTVTGVTGDAWSCTTANALATGSYSIAAINQDVNEYSDDAVDDNGYTYVPGGLSVLSNALPLTVGSGSQQSGDTGGSKLITPIWSFTIDGDTSDIEPGDTITISGSGLPAGTTLDTVLHSDPVDLGPVVAAADGTFTQTVTIPADTIPGAHELIVTATGPGLVTTTQTQPITITAPPSSGSGSSTTTVTPQSGKKTSSDTGDSTPGIQPNILTKALTPLADVAVHPNKIVSAVEIGLVLLLLAVLPAHLLEQTISEQSDRFERRMRHLPKTPGWIKAIGAWFTNAPVAAGIVVTLVTALVLGFADPHFGFTLASLRLILASAIALFLVGYVANRLTAAIARNQWKIVVHINTRPYGIILTILGVLVSRLLDFAPGFLIGLILGLTIQGKSAAGYAWRTVVIRTSIVLGMAIAAWIAYSTITFGGDEGGTFGTALLVETLVAVTTEGVVALLVELLPLRFLEGERVYAHSKILWGIFYVFTVIVFVIAVVPWEGNWSALGSSLWIWIVVLAAFTLVCLGVYFYFRRFAKPLEEEAGNEEVSLAETVKGDDS